jgi:hypothetical protein
MRGRVDEIIPRETDHGEDGHAKRNRHSGGNDPC